MARYFIFVRVMPVDLAASPRRILAVRTVRAGSPREALTQGLRRVQTELLNDLGAQALRDATFTVTELSRPPWYNWRRPNSNFVLEPEDSTYASTASPNDPADRPRPA